MQSFEIREEKRNEVEFPSLIFIDSLLFIYTPYLFLAEKGIYRLKFDD